MHGLSSSEPHSCLSVQVLLSLDPSQQDSTSSEAGHGARAQGSSAWWPVLCKEGEWDRLSLFALSSYLQHEAFFPSTFLDIIFREFHMMHPNPTHIQTLPCLRSTPVASLPER